MRTPFLFVILAGMVALAGNILAAEVILDSMDVLSFTPPKEKARAELVEGKNGKAIKFSFDKGASGAFVLGRIKGSADWDTAAGLSFWVKGDGSNHLGGLELIWNNDYAQRYACAFPIDSTEWKKIMVPWRDLLPETSQAGIKPLDPKNGNAPSKLGSLNFGKWWYWRDYEANSYSIDDIALEPTIELDTDEYLPKGPPLERVLAKLKAGKPITVVTMGDSLTDYSHNSNRKTNWPTMLKTQIKEKYGSEVTIVNPALGGTELRQNLVLIPRWVSTNPEPDLVTVCFGGNDWASGMRGEAFYATQKDAIARIRRATHGKSDVLIVTTCPSVENWDTVIELAGACRKAAKEMNAGLADTYAAFHTEGNTDKARLFADDKVHLGMAGQTLFAKTVVDAIEKDGKN